MDSSTNGPIVSKKIMVALVSASLLAFSCASKERVNANSSNSNIVSNPELEKQKAIEAKVASFVNEIGKKTDEEGEVDEYFMPQSKEYLSQALSKYLVANEGKVSLDEIKEFYASRYAETENRIAVRHECVVSCGTSVAMEETFAAFGIEFDASKVVSFDELKSDAAQQLRELGFWKKESIAYFSERVARACVNGSLYAEEFFQSVADAVDARLQSVKGELDYAVKVDKKIFDLINTYSVEIDGSKVLTISKSGLSTERYASTMQRLDDMLATAAEQMTRMEETIITSNISSREQVLESIAEFRAAANGRFDSMSEQAMKLAFVLHKAVAESNEDLTNVARSTSRAIVASIVAPETALNSKLVEIRYYANQLGLDNDEFFGLIDSAQKSIKDSGLKSSILINELIFASSSSDQLNADSIANRQEILRAKADYLRLAGSVIDELASSGEFLADSRVIGAFMDLASLLEYLKGSFDHDMIALARDSELLGIHASIDGIGEGLDSLDSKLQQIQDGANGLETSIGRIQKGADGVEETVGRTQKATDGVNSTVGNTQSAVNGVNATLEQTQNAVNGVNTTLNQTQNAVNGVNTTLNQTQGATDGVKTTVEQTQDAANGVNSTLKQTQGAVNDLNTGLGQTQGAVNSLNTGLGQTQDAANGVNSTLKQTQGAVNDLNTGLEQTQGAANGVKTTVEQTQGAAQGVNATLNQAIETSSKQTSKPEAKVSGDDRAERKQLQQAALREEGK